MGVGVTASILYLIVILFITFCIKTLLIPNHLLLITNAKPYLKKAPNLPLRFDSESATFKILQVSDMHFGTGISRCRDVLPSQFHYCSDANTSLFLNRLIEEEKPHFLAFTGDNIFGSSTPDAAESLLRAFDVAMRSGIPWAAVLGNHDQESTMNRYELISFISLLDYSVSKVNPSGYSIDGFGNYDLNVLGPLGSDLANTSLLSLYFLDSGDREVVNGIKTYNWIRDSQLSWLHDVSRGNQYLEDSPPALAFFHIPILEIRQLYYQKIVGNLQEAVACSLVNSGVLRTLVSMGDVKAVFVGHDHNNDFCGNLDGIWFCYGGGFGYHGYGKVGWTRRGRIIVAELGKGEKSWTGVKRIRTWKRLDDEKLSKIDEQVLWELQRSR